MRIGLVVDASMNVPGGVQEYVRGLYDYLNTAGHSPSIITAPEAPNPADQARHVLKIGHRIDVHRVTGVSAAAALTWADSDTIDQFLARERFDVLHYMAPTGVLSNQIIARSKATNILTLLITKDKIGAWLMAAALFRATWGRLLTPHIHGRIAISAPARDYGLHWYPGPCTIIPAGINVSRFCPDRGQRNGKVEGKLTVLFVGRLDPRKGIPHLLEAYAKVRQNHHNLRLVLVGNGPEAETSRAYVEAHHVPDVEFTGQVSADALPYYYQTADIFCAPAYENESFGVVLLEAMAAGLPIVGYANEGYSAVLTGEAQMALAPPGDVEALTQRLSKVTSDHRLRQRLSEWSRRTVQRYSWQSVGEQIVAFYQQVIAQQARAR